MTMEDWPELNRYRAANAALPPPAPNEQRIVFMGDSITDGWPLEQAFPGQPYVNRGISGQTTPQMLIRFRPDVIALQPCAVVILAGTNDIAGNTGPTTPEAIQDNFVSMCELARHNGIRVVLASVLPIHDYARFYDGAPLICSQQRPPQQIVALNAWLKNYAVQQGHVYLDYFAAMVDEYGMLRAGLADDGLHPNAQGYAVMAPLAAQAIQQTVSSELTTKHLSLNI